MMTARPSMTRRKFLHLITTGAGATALMGSGSLTWASSFKGVPPNRLKRLARGANICRWFRGRNAKAEELADYVTESEAKRMREIGLTHVRLCLQPRAVMEASTGEVRQEVAPYVDAAI